MFFFIFRDDLINFLDGIIVKIIQDKDFYFFHPIGFRHGCTGSHRPANYIFFIIDWQLN